MDIKDITVHFWHDAILKFPALGTHPHWWPHTGYNLVWSAILVQRSTWENAEIALSRLFNHFFKLNKPTTFQQYRHETIDLTARFLESQKYQIVPRLLLSLSSTSLSELIKPAGMSTRKARTLHEMATFLEAHRNQPSFPTSLTREQFLAIWGIGEETADTLLTYFGNQSEFIADNYARRIFSRLLDREFRTYRQLKDLIQPRFVHDSQLAKQIHGGIVEHASHFCLHSNPLCSQCSFKKECEYSKDLFL